MQLLLIIGTLPIKSKAVESLAKDRGLNRMTNSSIAEIPVVILAGGKGTRLAEETKSVPKPLVQVGDKPILKHIIDFYYSFGFKKFIICCGYKSDLIKDYFLTVASRRGDLSINLLTGEVRELGEVQQDITVDIINTGVESMTGGRLLAIKKHLEGSKTFCMTYGDGLADVDLASLIQFHFESNAKATVTAVQPEGRFGALMLNNDRVVSFSEKVVGDESWINGGYFVLSESVLDLIESPQTIWEAEPLEALAQEGDLVAFKHRGFWHPMDTLRDKEKLQEIWEQGSAPWVRR